MITFNEIRDYFTNKKIPVQMVRKTIDSLSGGKKSRRNNSCEFEAFAIACISGEKEKRWRDREEEQRKVRQTRKGRREERGTMAIGGESGRLSCRVCARAIN